MDNNKLDEMLHEMKKDYDKLPEYGDKDTIMKQIFSERKISWNKLVPTFAAIAGLLIFVVITLGTIESEQHSDEENSELMQYFLEKKEDFRQSLGVENVDFLQRVKHAKGLVDHYESSGDIGKGKESIYELLETPEMKVNAFNETVSTLGAPDYYNVKDVISKMKDYQSTFQYVLDRGLTNTKLDSSDEQVIIRYQDNVKAYYGPEKIKGLLSVLNRQGYLITRSISGELTVKVDYKYIIENLDFQHSEGTAYVDYLKLLATQIDPGKPGIGNDYGVDWTEFDEVLLSVEELYNSYENEQRLHFRAQMYYYTTVYLNDYLSAGVNVGEPIPANAQKEFGVFLEQHKKSNFASLIKEAINQYKANNWVRTDYQVSEELARKTLESDSIYNVQESEHDNKIEDSLLPIKGSLLETYEQFEMSLDSDLLKGLSAFEVMQLYMHASDNGDFDALYAMYDKKGVLADVSKKDLYQDAKKVRSSEFHDLAKQTDYILVDKQPNEQRTIFYFVKSGGTNQVSAFQMVQGDQGIWRVPFMPMQ